MQSQFRASFGRGPKTSAGESAIDPGASNGDVFLHKSNKFRFCVNRSIFSQLLTRAAPIRSHDREGVVLSKYQTVFMKRGTKDFPPHPARFRAVLGALRKNLADILDVQECRAKFRLRYTRGDPLDHAGRAAKSFSCGGRP